MKLKQKFRIADKESKSSEEMANRCEKIANEYLSEFIDWLHAGQTYALKLDDMLKLFKQDYEKRSN
jgi:hypothetical protein